MTWGDVEASLLHYRDTVTLARVDEMGGSFDDLMVCAILNFVNVEIRFCLLK